MSHGSTLELVEVAPRDGLQSVGPFVPTELKIDIIAQLYAAGLRRIEVTSFVSTQAVPQMADASRVVAAVKRMTDLDASVLVPTVRLAERALEAGARHLVFVLSVSEAHNRSNVKRSPLESVTEYAQITAMLPSDVKMRLNLATAFDCPTTGRVDEVDVSDLLNKLIDVSPSAEIALCDTTGRATPAHVGRLFRNVMDQFPQVTKWAFHGHDTYGVGTANVFAAWQAGVRVIDASCAGLGGCPFAPGATGNVSTEDVIWMMQEMGVTTGVCLAKLCAIAERLVSLPGAQTGGRVRQALSAQARRNRERAR